MRYPLSDEVKQFFHMLTESTSSGKVQWSINDSGEVVRTIFRRWHRITITRWR